MRISKSTQKQKCVTSTSIQLPPQDPSVIRGVFTIGCYCRFRTNPCCREGETPLLQVKLCEQGKRCDQGHLPHSVLHSAHHTILPGTESELRIVHPTSKWTLKPSSRIILFSKSYYSVTFPLQFQSEMDNDFQKKGAFYGQCHLLAKHHQFGAENTELTGSPAGWLEQARSSPFKYALFNPCYFPTNLRLLFAFWLCSWLCSSPVVGLDCSEPKHDIHF